MERILGKIEGEQPGPLVVCVAALHGNEQIGLHAFRNVHSSIINHEIPFKGTLVGIVGNIKAVQCNQRFLDYDLNRAFTEENIRRVNEKQTMDEAEDEELAAIYDIIIRESSNGNYSEKVIADLHATSADKGNFVIVPEGEMNYPLIKSLHLPVVVEMDKYLRGTLASYFQDKGFTAFAFEGGAIGTGSEYQLHTSGLWEILDKVGCISHHDHENEDHYVQQLQSVSQKLPQTVKALYCHKVKTEDQFRMLPGFHNFQKVTKGQHIAMDKDGPIHAPMAGLIFMPLYQRTGEDGFFIVEEVPEFSIISNGRVY